MARIVVAFLLLGAGLVNLGLARGELLTPQGLLSCVAGAAELVAAVVVLRGTVPRRVGADVLARGGVVGLVAASVAGLALAVATPGRLGAAVLAAAALQTTAAVAIGAATRPRTNASAGRAVLAGGGARPAFSLALLFVTAVAVSTVTTVGLVDTEAGAHAVPHSEHHLSGHSHHGP